VEEGLKSETAPLSCCVCLSREGGGKDRRMDRWMDGHGGWVTRLLLSFLNRG